jgi:hypothetical protein
MSEEKVQESVQENLDIKVESKPESADSGLLQEVMAKKATIKERDARIAELEAAEEDRRQKQLSDEGKKDELLAEYKAGKEKDRAELDRLRKYEDDEKTNLIASIASDDAEAEELEKESLSTLRLLNKKIATKSAETPTARGSVGNQPPPDFTKMAAEDVKKNWGNILRSYKKINST